MSQRTTAKNKHKGTKIFSLSLYFFFGFVFWLWVINFTKSSDSSTGNSAIKSSSASSQISISPTQLQSEGIVQTQHQSSNLSDLSAPSLHPSIPFFRNPVLNLLSHPLHQSSFQQLSIDETLYRLHQTKECQHLPIFITMAKIASPIYAQLVENFQYTMERYNLLRCSLLICLNDLNCLNFCQEFSFPCYNYNESNEVNISQ